MHYLWRYEGIEEYLLSTETERPKPLSLVGELKLSGGAKNVLKVAKEFDAMAGKPVFTEGLNDLLTAGIQLVEEKKKKEE